MAVIAAIAAAGCSCDEGGSPGGGAHADGSAGAGGAPADSGADLADDVAALDGTPEVDVDVPAAARGDCPDVEWARAFGGGPAGSLSATERANAVAATADRAWFVGQIYGSPDLGGGALPSAGANRSLFVLALGRDGGHAFSAAYGDGNPGLLFVPQAGAASAVARAAGGLVVAGSFAGVVDFGLGPVWSTGEIDAVDAGLDGGFDAGTPCLFQCQPDAVVLSLEATGATRWVVALGGREGDAATAVAETPDGDAVAVGSFRGIVDAGGGASAASAGGRDAFVVRLDGATGAPRWLTALGGALDDVPLAVTVAPDGSVVVGGTFSGRATFGSIALSATGESDGFLAVLDADGNVARARALGATSRGAVTGVAASGAGIAVVGTARGSMTHDGVATTTRANDAFVGWFDGSLVADWFVSFGTHQNDEASGVALGPGGRLAVTGTVGFGSLDLGGGSLAGNTSDGAFLLELGEGGEHVCSRRYVADPTGEPITDAVSLGAALDGLGVAYSPDGALHWAGSLTGATVVGDVSIASSGGTDAIIARFRPR